MTRMPAIYDCQFIYCPWHLFARNCSTWMTTDGRIVCWLSESSVRVLSSRRFASSQEYEINHLILLQIFIIITNNNRNDMSPFHMRRTQHSHIGIDTDEKILLFIHLFIFFKWKIIKCKLFTQIHSVAGAWSRAHERESARKLLLLLSLLPTE